MQKEVKEKKEKEYKKSNQNSKHAKNTNHLSNFLFSTCYYIFLSRFNIPFCKKKENN